MYLGNLNSNPVIWNMHVDLVKDLVIGLDIFWFVRLFGELSDRPRYSYCSIRVSGSLELGRNFPSKISTSLDHKALCF